MPIFNPQATSTAQPYADPAIVPFWGHVPNLLLGRGAWYVDTPVPIQPSHINDYLKPTTGTLLSLSKGGTKISYKWELAEYRNEGDTVPAEVYVVKDFFSISGSMLSIFGDQGETLLDVITGGRMPSGIIGSVGGAYVRRPITLIAWNRNPRAKGHRIFVVSLYSAYADGLDVTVKKDELSQYTVTFKAARPAGIPANQGIGRIFSK